MSQFICGGYNIQPAKADDSIPEKDVREAFEAIYERRKIEGFSGRDGADRAKQAIDAAARRLKQPVYDEYRKRETKG